MFRTAIRNVSARKLRLLATGIAVFLGVAFMAGTLVLTDTIGRTFDHLFADVNAGTDAYVRSSTTIPGDGMMAAQRARLDDDLVATVARVPGVVSARGTVQGFAQLVGRDGKVIGKMSSGPPVLGLAWTGDTRLNPFRLSDGRAPRTDDEVVIDRASARKGHLWLGSRTRVFTQTGPVDVTVVGVARFGSTDSPGGASVVLFTDNAARALMASPGKVDAVAVSATSGVSQSELAARIRRALPPGAEVLTGAQITNENQSDIKKGLRFFTLFLLTFAVVSLVVGAFIIANTFAILVAQRARETALLRAIGASRRQILASVLLEAAAVGILASVAGLAAGVGLASLLRSMLSAMGIDLPGGPLVVAPHTAIAALGIGIAVCLASAVLPALRASKVAPVAAMRRSATETGGFRLGSHLVRAVTRVVGAPFVRLRGVSGNLARENAMRNPKRTATTAGALTVGVALVALISVVASSTKASIANTLDTSFTGDFVVDSGAMQAGGFSPDVAVQLGRLPQVAAAVGIRGTTAAIRGAGARIVGVDPRLGRRVADLGHIEGRIDDVADRADVDGAAIAVSEKAAKREGLRVGDSIELTFADTGAHQLRVAAIYAKADLVGDWVLGPATYERFVTSRLDLKVMIKSREGVRPSEVRRAVEGVAAGFPQATVQDRSAFADSQAAMVDQVVNLVYALLALAIVIALIGIANTLGLSILERTSEVGLLRAVGMTRGQVKSAVRWEAVIVALVGTLAGLTLGVAFAWAIVHALAAQGIHAFRVPFGQLAVMTVIAGLAGVVAAVGPARRAARLDVLDAIATV